MIGECQSDYKKMKEAYHLLEESMQYLEFWSTSAPAGVYVYGEMMDADEDSHSSVYMTGSRRLLKILKEHTGSLTRFTRVHFPEIRKS